MALGPTRPSLARAHVGLVVYPKQLAVEHAGGDDRHHDAGDHPEAPRPPPRATESAASPALFPLAPGPSPPLGIAIFAQDRARRRAPPHTRVLPASKSSSQVVQRERRELLRRRAE